MADLKKANDLKNTKNIQDLHAQTTPQKAKVDNSKNKESLAIGESVSSNLNARILSDINNQNKGSIKAVPSTSENTIKKTTGDPVSTENLRKATRQSEGKRGNKKVDFISLGRWQKALSESKYNDAIIESIKQNFIILIIALTLVVISISFCAKFIIPSRRLEKEFRTAKRALEAIKTNSNAPVVNLDKVAHEAMISANLSHAWREFCHTLHPQKENDESGASKTVRYRATALAENFFTEQTLVDTPLKTEFYKHLPGILTGLGIIGTFAGLIFGLLDFHITEDPSDVRNALENLINSVGNAFIVSGCAIGLAMLFTWREKSHVTERYKQVEDLSQLIDSLFDSGAGEEYLERLVAASENSSTQATHIKDSLVTDLKQILSELSAQQIAGFAHVGDNIIQAIHNGPSTTGGVDINRLLTDVLANFSSQMKETMENLFGGQMRGMSDLLTQTSKVMQETVGKFDELAAKMDSAGKGAADSMADRLNQAIDTMEDRQNLLNQKMGEFVAQINSIVSSSQAESSRKLKDTLFNLL